MLEYVLLFVGLVLLVKGADFLVDGSSALAKKLGVPSLVVGLTIVAFGTSLPELIVNIVAALSGNSEIAIGNIVGSNISNILLILGISVIAMNLKIQESTLTKEIPFAFLSAFCLLLFSLKFYLDGGISGITKVDSIFLLIFFLIYVYYVYHVMKNDKGLKEQNIIEQDKIKDLHLI
ncbi:MAG: hypothetical protein WC755_05440 [Candidatus Woesearchaeota archaeon]